MSMKELLECCDELSGRSVDQTGSQQFPDFTRGNGNQQIHLE